MPGVSNPNDGQPASTGATDNRRLRRLLRWFALCLILLALGRIFVIEPYNIPTGSMRPTIVDGDVVLVNKLPYMLRSPRTIPFTSVPIPFLELPGLGTLRRGDVVLFDNPEPGRAETLVKRCVAVAGDTVQFVDGRIRVNGVELAASPDAQHRRSPISRSRVIGLLRSGNPVVVPYKGYRIEMDSMAAALWRPWIEAEGVSVAFDNRIVFLGGLPATNYTFQRDYFFALGDNDAESRDSRSFGFVSCNALIGEALFVYWSHNADDGVRWGRIGTIIR